MSKEMLNEKTFANVETLQPVTIPGRPDEVVRTKVMTINGTINRAAFLLLIAIVSAVFGWDQADQISGALNAVMLIGLLGLIGLSILTAFKPKIAPFTGPVYAVVMGFWAGVISFGYESFQDGIVLQAVFATLSVFAACLFLYGSRIIKVTKKFIAVVMMATMGIFLMYLVAIVMGLFGVELPSVPWASSPSPSTWAWPWSSSPVYPILVRAHGLSVKQYFSGVWPAVQLAFVSRSSVGTLPLTQRVTERSLGVPRAYASFAVPLGATTKMDGCAAIYPAISAIFVAQFFGIQLDFTQYLLIALVSGWVRLPRPAPPAPSVMLTLTLSTLGLPLAGVGLLLAIDPILDMGRTAVNVAGQALVPTIVAKRQGILDEQLYNAPRNGTPFVDDSFDAADADAICRITDGTTTDTAPRHLEDAKA